MATTSSFEPIKLDEVDDEESVIRLAVVLDSFVFEVWGVVVVVEVVDGDVETVVVGFR